MMNRLLRYSLLPVLLCWTLPVQAQPLRTADYYAGYTARCDSLITYFANRVPAEETDKGGYWDMTAKLLRGQDLDWVLTRLDTLMQSPRGDMFWMYPITTAYFAGRDRLPAEYQARMRDLWRTYMPYRGDTENHWLMYYATLYLMSQEYPGEAGETWYTGKSSEENKAEAEAYILHWIDLTTTIGQGEYDSPHYFRVYIAPLALLYGFATDPAMKRRAQMMIDYVVADFAAESLNGLYGGAHSRIYEHEVVAPYRVAASRLAWLLFGNAAFGPGGESLILALSGYRPPEILYHIATDRQTPYVHTEYKRTRHRIRNSAQKNAPVYKYTKMRPAYVLGSSQGGLLQPIQQQTWDLTWAVPGRSPEVHNTFFALHPYSSPLEGTMYFSEQWDLVTELIVRSKTAYDSPDKWTGGSPYEQVMQHEDALIALYSIPEGTRFEHITGFFSKDLSVREEDESGWIFARGGDALIGFYPLAPYRWHEEPSGDWRFHSPRLKNGYVVQVAPATDFENMAAFKAAVRALPLTAERRPDLAVTFTSLDGTEMVATYGQTPTVNGVPVDYENWPLFAGPFLNAERGSRTLELRHGNRSRVLDFNTLTITDRIHPTDQP